MFRIFSKALSNGRKLKSKPINLIRSLTTSEGCILKSHLNDVIIPNSTIDQFVWENYSNWGNKVMTVCGITGRQYTYSQMRDQSAALALKLQNKLKLKVGESVAVCLPNIPEYPSAILGPLEAGLVVTPINPYYNAEEISRQIISSDAKVIIGTVDNYEVLKNVQTIIQRPLPIICIKTQSGESIPSGTIDFAELSDLKNVDFSLLKRNQSKSDSISFLPYSSGTTGLAKGVELTHRNVVSNCLMIDPYNFTLPTTSTFQDVLPCVLPFFHIYGLTITLLSKIALGCKLVTLPKFTPDTFLNSLAEHKATVLHLVPPIVIFLGNYDKVEKKHVDSLRCAMSGAAPMGAADAERLLVKAPNVSFAQGYGLTEASPLVLLGSFGSKNYASAGMLIPSTEGKIVSLDDPTNKGLPVNEIGELLVRGPQMMKGYRNNQKATDDMILKDGWLRTGDLGYYDQNNDFYITDRLKELIKVKGFQVPPAELEEILREHPKVMEAGVVGIPHPTSGEVPRAFVVPKPNSGVTEKELQDFVAKKVTSYKKLDGGVKFLESIPKNASGKILRRELKKLC